MFRIGAVGAALLVPGCVGSDDGDEDPQAVLAERLVDDAGFEVDATCVRARTDELSDADARFLIDNFDADDVEAFGAELQAWIDGLFDCVTGVDDTGDANAGPDAVSSCMAAAGFPMRPSDTFDDEVAAGLGIDEVLIIDTERVETFGSVTFYESVGRAEADAQAIAEAASDDQAVGRIGTAVFAVEDEAGPAVLGCLGD